MAEGNPKNESWLILGLVDGEMGRQADNPETEKTGVRLTDSRNEAGSVAHRLT